MPTKSIVRTRTEEKHDGTTTTLTERIEEREGNGLLEAWVGLVLLGFTILIFLITYRVVSMFKVERSYDYEVRRYPSTRYYGD